MSHSVNVLTQFKDISLLQSVFESFDWKIKTEDKCRTYPTDPSKDVVHQYVAVNPLSHGYDVGIDVDSDGNAVFTCDFFDKSIEEKLGKNLKNIKQGYSLSKLKKFMSEEDLDYKVETLNTGELKIIATK
jgi:hypothetical protein